MRGDFLFCTSDYAKKSFLGYTSLMIKPFKACDVASDRNAEIFLSGIINMATHTYILTLFKTKILVCAIFEYNSLQKEIFKMHNYLEYPITCSLPLYIPGPRKLLAGLL